MVLCEGDYSFYCCHWNLSSFLLNQLDDLSLFLSVLNSQAEGFKEQGNVFYSQKAYSEAFNCYTKAIGE